MYVYIYVCVCKYIGIRYFQNGNIQDTLEWLHLNRELLYAHVHHFSNQYFFHFSVIVGAPNGAPANLFKCTGNATCAQLDVKNNDQPTKGNLKLSFFVLFFLQTSWQLLLVISPDSTKSILFTLLRSFNAWMKSANLYYESSITITSELKERGIFLSRD